ncbi:MAG: HEAT repeat domain-containing protein [Deltaproteobacteria bacterium]|nr:HEAT repeat domain-containing protein [Deltaproteobacteria bacterium]
MQDPVPGNSDIRIVLFLPLVLIQGLFLTQILATLHIYGSNQQLKSRLATITDAGYLAIPNPNILDSLNTFWPSFWGGLFMTLSIGAGLSLFGLIAAMLWRVLLKRNKWIMALLLLVWLGSVAMMNVNGLNAMVSLYFLMIPPSVFGAALKWMPSDMGKPFPQAWFVPLLSMAALAICGFSQLQRQDLFLDIRDRLLLSNSFGTTINDFYYQYTRYPSAAIESFNQRLLRTCNLDGVGSPSLKKSLERILINHDYLPINDGQQVDLFIEQRADGLLFKHGRSITFNVSPVELTQHPSRVLDAFSAHTDRNRYFRWFGFLSLLIAFPLVLYIFVHALFAVVLCFFMGLRAALIGASIICFVLGVSLLIPLHLYRDRVSDGSLERLLRSGRWQDRTAVLKTIYRTKAEIAAFDAYKGLLGSRFIAERYWLMKAMGVSESPETFGHLVAFLKDPHPNVKAAAYDALGNRKNPQAVKAILDDIKALNAWYPQWYAYKALRELGWNQRTRSDSRP